MKTKTWDILNDSKENIIDILLDNRGLRSQKEKDEFLNPTKPQDLSLKDLDISVIEIKKAIKRLIIAKEKKEKVIVYGDYDADGVTATAIMWEALHKFGLDVMPYIPDRFEEGYGINANSVAKIKETTDIKLIITVDNGIVANEEIKKVNKLGIDVIVTDHHEVSKIKPKALAIIHTKKIAGSAVAWILSRELGILTGLELAAIGTIADQMPLVFANRSFALWGINELRKTKRAGITELIKQAAIKLPEVGTYEINYIIAPRINSMGRLANAMDSLRLLCTKDAKRARELAELVSKTNLERQKIVDNVVKATQKQMQTFSGEIIFLSSTQYHEGVIGLAAGRLVEEFYRPAIVVSVGTKFSKGSARSISGINIIELIRAQSEILVAHGGHTMAAGFTIQTSKLEEFRDRLNQGIKNKLTPDILLRKLRVDCELPFDLINWELTKKFKQFEPTGMGNPTPTFVSYKTEIIDAKILGKDKTHLKLKLKKDDKFFDAIGFGMADFFEKLAKGDLIDIVYNLDENDWNGIKSLQLRVKDIKF